MAISWSPWSSPSPWHYNLSFTIITIAIIPPSPLPQPPASATAASPYRYNLNPHHHDWHLHQHHHQRMKNKTVMFCSQWLLQHLPVKQSSCAFFLQPDPLPFMENSHLVLLCLPGTKPWSSYSLESVVPGSDWVSRNQCFQSLALDRKWEPWRLSPLRIALITCLCVPCEDRGRWRV